MQKSLGRAPKGLQGPALPEAYRYLWEMFLDLHSGRSYSQVGPNPLSWTDIRNWSDLMHMSDLREWEVRALKRLDSAWLRSMHKDTRDG